MADARYISDRVKKQLYALSGNECANPLCNNKLVFPDDNAKDDQICHIEAASPDGPRFNPNQTDEERRGFDNLILLCHKCHDMIDNNPDKYTVEILKKWKQDHEAKYKNNNTPKNFSFPVPDGLLPRDNEADNLYNCVIANRFFNLVGVGGSGKSSLASLMIQKHEEDFNEIAYVVVNNNIKNDFVEQINKTLRLEFEKDEDAFSELIDHLQNDFKSEHPNLLVLDINETSDKDKNDEIINSLIKNRDILDGWKILILSRENVDTRNRIATHNLNEKEDVEFLKELFLSKAGTRYNDFGDFAELFKTIFYNPLLAEQLGLYLNEDPELATIDDIKKILYGDSFREEDMQGLSADRHDEPIVSFLTNLIKYNDLPDNEKNLLRHFVLWQAEYIGYDVIKDLLKGVFESDEDLKNALKSLSKRSILATNNDKTLSYKLHGLLAESIREQIDIDNEDYDEYLDNIERIIEYDFRKFWPYADCIGNSLCEYDLTTDYILTIIVADKFAKMMMSYYSAILYEITIDMLLDLLTYDPKNVENQADLAMTFNQLALLQSDQIVDYQSAESNYKRAIKIGEQLPKDNPEYQDGLARAYYNYANLQKNNLKEYTSAELNYKKAIEISEQLPKDNSDYQHTLASLYNNYALLQDTYYGDYELAKSYYFKAIKIEEQISNNQNNVAISYSNIAYCFVKQNKVDEAIAMANKAIFIGQELKDEDSSYLIDLINYKHTLADIYFNTNDIESAQSILSEIKPQAEQCLADDPDDKETQKVNKEINKLWEKISTLES